MALWPMRSRKRSLFVRGNRHSQFTSPWLSSSQSALAEMDGPLVEHLQDDPPGLIERDAATAKKLHSSRRLPTQCAHRLKLTSGTLFRRTACPCLDKNLPPYFGASFVVPRIPGCRVPELRALKAPCTPLPFLVLRALRPPLITFVAVSARSPLFSSFTLTSPRSLLRLP